MRRSRAIGFVFARAGSKGLKGKNIRTIGGVPLLVLAVQHLLESRTVERVVVSTDSARYAAIARAAGAQVPFLRPAELAGDASAEHLAWQHAVNQTMALHGEFDIFVSAPATAPLRRPEHIRSVVEALQNSDADGAVTVIKLERNPMITLVTMDDRSGEIVRLGGAATRRQDAPVVFQIVPVCYAATTAHVRQATSFYEGRIVGMPIPEAHGVDIDTLEDLSRARQFRAAEQRREQLDSRRERSGLE